MSMWSNVAASSAAAVLVVAASIGAPSSRRRAAAATSPDSGAAASRRTEGSAVGSTSRRHRGPGAHRSQRGPPTGPFPPIGDGGQVVTVRNVARVGREVGTRWPMAGRVTVEFDDHVATDADTTWRLPRRPSPPHTAGRGRSGIAQPLGVGEVLVDGGVAGVAPAIGTPPGRGLRCGWPSASAGTTRSMRSVTTSHACPTQVGPVEARRRRDLR